MAESGEIAYVVKAWPRLSELFVAGEVERVEQAGVPLRLYALLDTGETVEHAVVTSIAARPEYLRATTPLETDTLPRWLRRNGRQFLGPARRLALRRPRGLVRGVAAGLAQARRGRHPGRLLRPLNLKELLLAVDLADRLVRRPAVVHVHAHFAHSPTTVTWLACRIAGLPFSFTAHAKDIYDESHNPAGLLRRKMRAAQFVVTCTDANRAHLGGIDAETIVHRIYHGLNAELTQLLRTASAPHHEEPGAVRIIAVGRLVAKKGFDVLLDACVELDRRGIPFKLRLIGPDGEAAPALRERAAAAPLAGRVELPGAMTQQDLAEEYRVADVFALPCRILANGDRDGIPNVLVEALAAGLPIVSTPISGIPELIVDGETGLLVPPDDPVRLADAIERLHRDRPYGRRLGAAGAAVVCERFDGDSLARELAALFPGVRS